MNKESLIDLIKSRRSVKLLDEGNIPLEKVIKALETAITAPSAHNAQPWRFIIIKDPRVKATLLEAMAKEWRKDLEKDGLDRSKIDNIINAGVMRSTRASMLVVACLTMEGMDIYADERRQRFEYIMAVQSLSAAIQNFLLALHALGLASCWRCSALFAPEVVREVLNLPEEVEPQALIDIGPSGIIRNPSRKPLKDVVFIDRWGNKL